KFRDDLGPASGFQSYTYRKLEFLLGNKNRRLVQVHKYDSDIHQSLSHYLEQPSLYDVVIRKLHQAGFAIDPHMLERDWGEPYQRNDSVQTAWRSVYQDSDRYFEFYELAEKLVDIEDAFQSWRFKHMYTVQRVIGFRQGTGGSSGVPFLKRALDISFFPELLAIRTEL
ncbi:MAG: tryptophan 2,3-dioxygenase family protein, partial [Pseudomonadota bacterium]